MSNYQTRSPYSRSASAMDADAINRAADAMRGAAEAISRATASLNSNTPSASSPMDEKVRRKPIGREPSRPRIRTNWTPADGDMGTSMLSNAEPMATETPTIASNVRARILDPEQRTYYNRVPIYDDVDGFSSLRGVRDRPNPQYAFTGYDYNEDFRQHNIDAPCSYSSTTLDSTRPIDPMVTNLETQVPVESRTPSSTTHEIGLIATICLAHFFTQCGLAQSIAPLPLIADSFTTLTHAASPTWYSAAYSLTVGTFILPSGRLGDIYGPKRIFMIGWLWFTVASLGAGFNPRILESIGQQETFFCFCRAMQGIGPALLMPNGLAILGRTYEEGNKKNMAFALFGASAPVGFVIGSIMSSLLAEKTYWSWAYWGLAIACAVMAVISVFMVPSLPGAIDSRFKDDKVEEPSKEPMWKQLDIPGAILGISGLILINVALNQAPLVSWSTPYTYFLLIMGFIILSFFFFIEFTPSLTPHPLIPRAMLSLDTYFVLACIACGWGTFGIWIFYTWDFLETLRGLDPLLASAQFAPAAISGLLAAVTTGILLSKTTPQVIMVIAMFAFFVGTTLIATAPVSQIYWAQAFFSIIIMPWGMDMSFPSATILLSSKAGHEHQGVAASLVNTVVNYSISVGLGLAGTVQSNVDRDGTNILAGIRSAWYVGMGLSGFGIAIAVLFVAITAWKAKGVQSQKEPLGEA